MKKVADGFVYLTVILFSKFALAEENADLSRHLADSKCIPIVNNAQVNGYNCGEKNQNITLKTGDVATTKNGEPVESASKALELYNEGKLSGQSEVPNNNQ